MREGWAGSAATRSLGGGSDFSTVWVRGGWAMRVKENVWGSRIWKGGLGGGPAQVECTEVPEHEQSLSV